MDKPTESKEHKLYQEFTSKMKDVLKDEDAKKIFASLSMGENSYLRIDRIESSSFDLNWINNIESCIPDLGTIILNPRLTTKTVQDLVPVELARKVNADSVKHLASHTQYIKDIDENGDVIPNKILNIGADDEVKTYENKFIATLIRMLVMFVEKRYQFVKNFAILHNHETLFFKNKSRVGNADVEIETKVKVISDKLDAISIQNNKYIERIEEMRQYILYFYNSKFMKMFKTERNVRSPILQTNILRKNPLYHHCYELYRFIEAYDSLGVAYAVDEKFTQFNENQLNELNCLMFANYLALQGKDKDLTQVGEVHHYAPKIITSSDDEKFVYGPLLRGPITFLRVDEAYQRFLDSQVAKDIPEDEKLREDKRLKYYYRQEIDVRKLNRRTYEEKIKFLERKKWDKLQYDKDVEAIIEQRKREEEEERRRRVQERLRQEDEYLAKFRQHIVDEALAFRPEYDQEAFEHSLASQKAFYQSATNQYNEPTFNNSSKALTSQVEEELERELTLQELRLAHNEHHIDDTVASSIERENDFEEKVKRAQEAQIRASLEAQIRKELRESIYEELKAQAMEEAKAQLAKENEIKVKQSDESEADLSVNKVTLSDDSSAQGDLPAPIHSNNALDQEVESENGREVLRESSAKTDVKSMQEGKEREIPVPIPMDYDDPRRLTPDEKKAVLLYNLFQDTLEESVLDSLDNPSKARKGKTKMHSGIFGTPNGQDPEIPFSAIDEDYLDPFERIRALNHAYYLYNEEYGPFVEYPDYLKTALTKDVNDYHFDDNDSNEAIEEILTDNLLPHEEDDSDEPFEALTRGLLEENYLNHDKELYVVYCSKGYVATSGYTDDIDSAYIYKDRASATIKALEIHGKLINLI